VREDTSHSSRLVINTIYGHVCYNEREEHRQVREDTDSNQYSTEDNRVPRRKAFILRLEAQT